MSVNSLPTRIRDDEKVPVPIENESYFYQHSPVKFSVEIKEKKNKNAPRRYTAYGMVFITDKRLMFVTEEPTSDGNGTIINMAITYDLEDLEDKRIFEDYYGMLITWATKMVPEKYKNAEGLLSDGSREEEL
ncbi:3749_t:CDS:2 [Acaulospora colombiana]|uniref:3749_t:CDS:1 n=1 Tax=Acaulospora colombiana TaxID=27376 RepID=A0ACA9N8J6_9GLOM|nr:3749_t:CDS:2 [Acaulospora colombiana]